MRCEQCKTFIDSRLDPSGWLAVCRCQAAMGCETKHAALKAHKRAVKKAIKDAARAARKRGKHANTQ